MFVPLVVYASAFVYYPLTCNITQVSPPLQLYVINTNGITGVNRTSATINITASKSQQSLISNPGFTYGADEWYYTTNNGKLAAAWLNNDSNLAQGVILVYNDTIVSNISDSILYLYQNFTVPEQISAVNYSITYRLDSEPEIYYTYLYLGIYNWSNGSTTWFIDGQTVDVSSSYSTTYGTASITLTPGNTYAILVGVELYQILYFSSYNFYFLIDSVNLTYTPHVETFSNNVLGIKVNSNYTINYTMEFKINKIVGGSNISANLTLYSDYGSNTISIIDGTPNATETDWIKIRYGSNSLYYDGDIKMTVKSYTNETSMTIEGTLIYTPESSEAYVYYSITIYVKG